MNIRLYSLGLLISAIPLFAQAEAAGISLNKGDFTSIERQNDDGETTLNVKLSKSGKAKLKKLKTQQG